MIDWSALFRSLTVDTLDTVDTLATQGVVAGNLAPGAVQSVNSVQSVNVSEGKSEPVRVATRLSPIVAAFSGLKRRCPAHVDDVDWQRAVDDGRRLLMRWGPQVEALGWSADDLFGLAPVPERPASTYRRLSRYDLTGLVWMLHSRAVVALTADTAVIRTKSSGTVTFYRRNAPCYVR